MWLVINFVNQNLTFFEFTKILLYFFPHFYRIIFSSVDKESLLKAMGLVFGLHLDQTTL